MPGYAAEPARRAHELTEQPQQPAKQQNSVQAIMGLFGKKKNQEQTKITGREKF